MGRIPEEDVAKVRDATDLVSLINETVPLRQKGRLFWGLCPFHGEKTPSFKVDPATQLWHCFGCGLGGDAFGFVMRAENLEFPEAIRQLAERANVEIHEEAGGVPSGRRERLIAACDATAAFYHELLTTSKEKGASAARDYLGGRGFGSDVAKRYRLGYAPSERARLSSHLTKSGFSRDELVEANLSLVEPSGSLKDRFFDRIMFPIYDVTGKCVAFGGRVLGSGEPKYLNSADTPIFHKSSNMYGIHLAKGEIVATGTAVVVEGYTDVIALHEAGIANVVATLGTALTGRHVKLLARFAKRVVYLFDGDEAGLRAADRAAEFLDGSSTPEAGSARIDLGVAVIPGGEDPADHVASAGADAVRALVEEAQPLLRFVLDRRLDAHDLSSPEGREAGLAAAARVLAGVRGSILAQDYANYVAGRLVTDYETVMSAVRGASPEFSARREEPEEATGEAPRRARAHDAQGRAEEALLRQLTVGPDVRERARELLSFEDAVTDPANRRLAEAILAAGGAVGKDLVASVRASEPELADELSAWLVDDREVADEVARFPETAGRLKEFALRRQILRLQSEMNGMDRVKDPDAYDDVFRRVAALQRERQALRMEATIAIDGMEGTDTL